MSVATSDITASAALLELPAALSIRTASATHALILDAFQSGGETLVLDIPADAEADLSFIQIVEASRRYAQTHGRGVKLAHPAAGSVRTTLDRGGFTAAMTAQDSDFWFHRKDLA